MSDAEYYARVSELLTAQTPFVSVVLVDTAGSVPQDAGRKMIVTAQGLNLGTVGGGKVEAKAIEEARQMLARETGKHTHFVNWSLSRDVGMTCGGQVKLYFESHNNDVWNIVVFGAGHIANALTNLLINLECRITCFDTRQEWLDKLPSSPKLSRVLAESLPAQIATLPGSAFVVLMTMGHSSDKPILLEILRTSRQFPYLGVIGSAAKAARLYRDIEEAGLPENLRNAFYCPMGLDIGSNHPFEIAVSIVAQLIETRDKYRSSQVICPETASS